LGTAKNFLHLKAKNNWTLLILRDVGNFPKNTQFLGMEQLHMYTCATSADREQQNMRHFESWVQLKTTARWETYMRQIYRLVKAEHEAHLKVGYSYRQLHVGNPTCGKSTGWLKQNMRHI
jgi:hypothetical protein